VAASLPRRYGHLRRGTRGALGTTGLEAPLDSSGLEATLCSIWDEKFIEFD